MLECERAAWVMGKIKDRQLPFSNLVAIMYDRTELVITDWAVSNHLHAEHTTHALTD